MKNKKIIFSYITIGLIVLGIAFIGVSYAYWNVTINQTNQNVVKAVCLKVTMTKDENEISLPKAIPISDEDGASLEPYTFSIENTCEDNASFQINLESLTKTGGTTEIAEGIRLNSQYVRFKLDETGTTPKETTLLLSNTPTVTPPVLKDAYESHKLMTGYLEPSETKNFELRLWLDKNADEGAMNKTFASKVTITNAYLEEDKIPPTADLDLAVCDMTITATGKGTANTGKSISKYEYKMDDDDWKQNSSSSTTFTAKDYGYHTISLKVTDNSGISDEVTKEVEIKKPETINIKGATIPIATCGDGLYRVEHNEEGVDEHWKETEYRFAGVNYTNASTSYVHNYVNFNNEKWRIIGLVNVKTKDGNYEQRLKIVRTDGVGDQKNFGSYYWDTSTNNWTTSKLKTMLNSSYYNSTSGDCYKSSTSATCDFSSGSELPKGLDGTAQEMVDGEVTWNLGGTNASTTSTVMQFYEYERGETVYNGRPTEWTTDDEEHKGVGLIYPSDYGYATNGGTSGRDYCFKKELYNWDTGSYQINCANKDWLKPSSSYLWTITPHSGYSSSAFHVGSTGYVFGSGNVVYSYVVWPVVYLKSNIQISDGEGTFDNPYVLVSGIG